MAATKVVRTKARKHWFHDKTPAQKKAYIAAHPNSIYAKKQREARGIVQPRKASFVKKQDERIAKLREEGTKLARQLESAQEKAEYHNERYQDMQAAGKPYEAEKKLYQDGVKKCREISDKIEEMRAEYKRLTK